MHVYVPATMAALSQFVADGVFTPRSPWGFTVTPLLKERYIYEEEEELDYIAFQSAADASLRLLASELTEPDTKVYPRRVVLQCEFVSDGPQTPTLRPDLDDSAVEIKTTITFDTVVAAYIDLPDSDEIVRVAALAIDEADLGSQDAQFIVDESHDVDLAWYATQEIPFVVELLD